MASLTDRIIGAESGGNPYARNPRSSAGGAGQFLDGTWLSMIQKYRPDLAAGKTKEQLLTLKFDPVLSKQMTDAYASENQGFLKQRGIDPNPSNTYLAHFAGPAGASALHANPSASAESVLGPKVIAANPFLKGKTAQDVIDWSAKKMGSSPSSAMATSLRSRFATSGSTPTQADTGANQKLLSAMTQGYDVDRIRRNKELADDGTKIASAYGNPIGAIGGTILAGLGSYMGGDEAEKKKAADEATANTLMSSANPMETIKALVNNPTYREAGLEMLVKLQTQKPPKIDQPGSVQEYEYAKGQGYKGTFQDFEIEKKRAGATNVSVDTGDKESAKQMARHFAENYQTIYKAGISARDTLGNLDLAQSALESGIRTGFGAEIEQSLRKIGASLGIGDVDKVASGELLSAVQNRMALQMRNPDSGMGMPGAMSDADREFLKASQLGLDKSPDGNKAMLTAARALENRKLEVAKMADEYLEKNGALDAGFNRLVRDYAEKNPLFAVQNPQPTQPPEGGFKILGVR